MFYDSINKNREFARIYKKGTCIVHKDIVVYYKKTNYNKIRVGITASKKVGNAVQRNRARRIIRVGSIKALENCSGSYDFVFVARKKTVCLKSTDIEKSLQFLLLKEEIIHN